MSILDFNYEKKAKKPAHVRSDERMDFDTLVDDVCEVIASASQQENIDIRVQEQTRAQELLNTLVSQEESLNKELELLESQREDIEVKTKEIKVLLRSVRSGQTPLRDEVKKS